MTQCRADNPVYELHKEEVEFTVMKPGDRKQHSWPMSPAGWRVHVKASGGRSASRDGISAKSGGDDEDGTARGMPMVRSRDRQQGETNALAR